MRDAGVADDGGFGITTTLDFADQCSASIAMRRPVLCIPYDLIRFRQRLNRKPACAESWLMPLVSELSNVPRHPLWQHWENLLQHIIESCPGVWLWHFLKIHAGNAQRIIHPIRNIHIFLPHSTPVAWPPPEASHRWQWQESTRLGAKTPTEGSWVAMAMGGMA